MQVLLKIQENFPRQPLSQSSTRSHITQGGKHDVRILTQGWPLEPLHPKSRKCHGRACQVQNPRFAHQAFASGASMCSVSAPQTAISQSFRGRCKHSTSSGWCHSRKCCTALEPLGAEEPTAQQPPCFFNVCMLVAKRDMSMCLHKHPKPKACR